MDENPYVEALGRRYLDTALKMGIVVEEDTVLDDEPGSPTEGRYFKLYRSTIPEPTKP